MILSLESIGFLTQNTVMDADLMSDRKKFFEVLSKASLTDSWIDIQKVMGISELKLFLETHQEEFLSDDQLQNVIWVSGIWIPGYRF